MYIYIYMHACMHICMYVWMYVCMYKYMVHPTITLGSKGNIWQRNLHNNIKQEGMKKILASKR